MKIFERKKDLFLKGEGGGRMMLRISLPTTEEDSELKLLYSCLESEYVRLGREFVGKVSGDATFFFCVSYETENGKKEIKIKRRSLIKGGKATLKSETHTDTFDVGFLKLKG